MTPADIKPVQVSKELIPFVLFHQLGIDPTHFCNTHADVGGLPCVELNVYTNIFDSGHAGYRILKKYDEGYITAKRCVGHHHESESLGLICTGTVAA